ncbi:MAG: class I SAM-dependent rRNA methyltransferase [Pontibacterium sp.]
MTHLNNALKVALDSRAELLTKLHAEQSNCYRLFHGTNEGQSGLSVDRYGPQLLIQSFHDTLPAPAVEQIVKSCEFIFSPDEIIYNDRSAKNSRRADEQAVRRSEYIGQELGVNYRVKGKHEGQDPLLFLDMRVGRRFVQKHAQGKTVLNLFSYTCGVGLCAALAGAADVVNVDFSTRSLAVGQDNAGLNGLSDEHIQFVQSDFFTAAKQFAGLPVKQRVRRGQKPRPYGRLNAREFDLVYLDPPRWAKSHFGTVDLVRDYPSVLKPALLATREGGTLICTNNVAQVNLKDWLSVVLRCAEKAGRPVRDYQILEPEADFPSPDGQFPLKIAVLQL